MNKVKEFINKLNWFERIFPIVALLIVTVSFIISPEKNWLSFVSAFIGVFAFFCVAKGLVIAPFLSIIQSIFYVIISYYQSYYGELILGALYILLSFVTIFTWLKNRNKKDKDFVQVNKIKPLEFVVIIVVGAGVGVGCYFMLRALNTNELLTSTFSMVASLISSYLVLRRSSYYSVGYIINDVIVVILWSFTIKSVGLAFLPTILGYAIYFVNDIYGLVNWKIMEKRQDMESKLEENSAEVEDKNKT